MRSRILGICGATLVLILSCSTPTRTEVVHDRSVQLHDALASAVPDPARRAKLDASLDAMEAAMVATLEENRKLNAEFAAASSDPAANAESLRRFAGRVALARRDGMRRVLEARLDLRRGMSADEWARFSQALPAFDGGES
jgi:hypothetical protein